MTTILYCSQSNYYSLKVCFDFQDYVSKHFLVQALYQRPSNRRLMAKIMERLIRKQLEHKQVMRLPDFLNRHENSPAGVGLYKSLSDTFVLEWGHQKKVLGLLGATNRRFSVIPELETQNDQFRNASQELISSEDSQYIFGEY